MSNFARLEIHDGLQVLCRVEAKSNENGEYGPCVVTRCDPSFTFEITEGPWPDDEDGWDAAEATLARKDLAKFAIVARSTAANFRYGGPEV